MMSEVLPMPCGAARSVQETLQGSGSMVYGFPAKGGDLGLYVRRLCLHACADA